MTEEDQTPLPLSTASPPDAADSDRAMTPAELRAAVHGLRFYTALDRENIGVGRPPAVGPRENIHKVGYHNAGTIDPREIVSANGTVSALPFVPDKTVTRSASSIAAFA